MKYLFSFLSVFLLTAIALLAQSQSDLDALKVMLGEEKYQLFTEKKPEMAAEYAYMNRHGYHVANMGDKDFSSYPAVMELEGIYPNEPAMDLSQFEQNNWNMFGFGVEPDESTYKYFRIGDTGMVLTVLPKRLARKKMNKEQKQK
jgi:hypothetical protein